MKSHIYIDHSFPAARKTDKVRITLIGVLRLLILALFSAFVVIALSSCGSQSLGEGVSGGVSYIDPDTGAQAGIEYRRGETTAYARHVIRDPKTGEIIGSIDLNKTLSSPPVVVTPEK